MNGPRGRSSVVNIHTSYTDLIYSSFATFVREVENPDLHTFYLLKEEHNRKHELAGKVHRTLTTARENMKNTLRLAAWNEFRLFVNKYRYKKNIFWLLEF